jgi:hypothetical protein
VTYKDVIRADTLKKANKESSDEDSDDDKPSKKDIFSKADRETVAEEAARLKAEFKKKAESFFDEESDESDGGLFKKKNKEEKGVEKEEINNSKLESLK